MILWRGERRTPKRMASILIDLALEALPGDWTPQNLPDPPTPAERLAVEVQIAKLKERIAAIAHRGRGEAG